MRRTISAFLANESGATAIEYALIASGLSIVILASVNGIGTSLNVIYKTVSTALK
jgi:pilus assembly protein Flp/PilA